MLVVHMRRALAPLRWFMRAFVTRDALRPHSVNRLQASLPVLTCVAFVVATVRLAARGEGQAAVFVGCWLLMVQPVAFGWLGRHRHVALVAMAGLALVSVAGYGSAAPLPSAPVASVTASPSPQARPSSSPTPIAASGACSSAAVLLTLHLDVSARGPWKASLQGSGGCAVRSVVYWERDAKHNWRAFRPANRDPFIALIKQDGRSGRVVVTADLRLRSGEVIDDLGGWHWVNRGRIDPGGELSVDLDTGGSAGATYIPGSDAEAIQGVTFWLRDAHGHWTVAGNGVEGGNSAWSLSHLAGTQTPGWNGPSAAVSVDVAMRGGTEFDDPTAWTWSSRFNPAPTPVPTPTPHRAAPTPAPPPPPTAKPAPPAAPVSTPAPAGPSCYPLSDGGTCYEPGEYCRDSDHGAHGIAGDGEAIVCEDDDGWRWEPA